MGSGRKANEDLRGLLNTKPAKITKNNLLVGLGVEDSGHAPGQRGPNARGSVSHSVAGDNCEMRPRESPALRFGPLPAILFNL